MENTKSNNNVNKTYHFEEITFCEMCKSDVSFHKIMGQRLNCSQGLNPKIKSGISVTVKKCKNCNLVFSSPQPIPFNISDHYGTPPEDYWNEDYFIWDKSYFLEQITVLNSLLPYHPNAKALDVGAGIGKGMISLEKAGYNTFGFEPSQPFYERAITKMNISSEKLKLGMIEDVDYEENSFDFITFGAVIEHLYHPSECIKKAMKWLKPSGLIHIEVPNSKHLISKLINIYYKLRGTSFVTNLSPMHNPFHLYEFQLKCFEMLGKELGFKVEKYQIDVCTIFFVPKILHPIARKIMELTNSGLQLTVWLRKI